MIKPGEKIFNSKKYGLGANLAQLNIKLKRPWRSIHKIGAYVQNKPACNGWTYWFVKFNDKKISINTHRIQLREASTSKE